MKINIFIIIGRLAKLHNSPDPDICRNHRRFSWKARRAISTRSGTRGNNRQQARRSKGAKVCRTPKTWNDNLSVELTPIPIALLYSFLPSVESVWVDLGGPFYWFPRQPCRSLSAAFHHNLSLFFLSRDGGAEEVEGDLKLMHDTLSP